MEHREQTAIDYVLPQDHRIFMFKPKCDAEMQSRELSEQYATLRNAISHDRVSSVFIRSMFSELVGLTDHSCAFHVECNAETQDSELDKQGTDPRNSVSSDGDSWAFHSPYHNDHVFPRCRYQPSKYLVEAYKWLRLNQTQRERDTKNVDGMQWLLYAPVSESTRLGSQNASGGFPSYSSCEWSGSSFGILNESEAALSSESLSEQLPLSCNTSPSVLQALQHHNCAYFCDYQTSLNFPLLSSVLYQGCALIIWTVVKYPDWGTIKEKLAGIVMSARDFLRFLKRALRILAAVIEQVLHRQHKDPVPYQFVVAVHSWLTTRGPRPPRSLLKRLLRCFQQVTGRVHSLLAA